jgi:hypothetical protein
MMRPSCPGCRLRFAREMPVNVAACPFCGEPLQPMAAEAVLGFQLAVAPGSGAVTDVDGLMRAVADAAREEEQHE